MIQDEQTVQVDEQVVLSKFDGDGTSPENETERIVIVNGMVVEHNVIENGEVKGPVEGSDNLYGANIGRLIPTQVKEVD